MSVYRETFLLFQVVNLFNMFITYGDTFLPTSNSYDELYYEIVRMHQVFDNLYCMGTLENLIVHHNGSRIIRLIQCLISAGASGGSGSS